MKLFSPEHGIRGAADEKVGDSRDDKTGLPIFSLYGETWTGAFALYVLVSHQTHHRGQMTVLMRQAGLHVPSTYGPTKEGWAEFGLEAPKV